MTTNKKTKWVAGVVVGAALVIGGAGVAAARSGAGSTDDDATETAITGPALTKAGAAAVAHVGNGRVTDTEVGDEEGYYEVEVTRDDGSQVDVHLDENFSVLSTVADDETDK